MMDTVRIIVRTNDYYSEALADVLALILWLYGAKVCNIQIELDPTYFEPTWEAIA